jgi:hypothetical protein
MLQITDIHSTCQVLLRKKLLWCLRHAKAAGGVAVTMAAIARRHRNPMGFFRQIPPVEGIFWGIPPGIKDVFFRISWGIFPI